VQKNPEEVITRSLLDLLKKLAAPHEIFLITNQSMYEVVVVYETELMSAIRRGAGAEVLQEWLRDVDSFRADWLSSPHAEQATLRNHQVKVATESATRDAHTKCSDRKQRPGSPPRGGSGRPSPSRPRRASSKKRRRRVVR
jgi:hypothetical protein